MGTHLGAVGVVWLMIWVFGCCGFIGYYGFRWCGDRRITIFPEGRDFAPRGLRGCPRAKPKGNLKGRGVQSSCTREIGDVLVFCGCQLW